MESKSRVLLGCVIALVVGATAVSPLVFSNLQAASAETAKPQFDVNVAYAYVGVSNTTFVDYSNETNVKFGPWVKVPSINYKIGFNLTRMDDPHTVAADCVIEYFLVDVSSDRGFIGNLTYYAATYNDKNNMQFFFSRAGWFDSNMTAGYVAGLNWTTGQTERMGMTGEAISWYPAFGNPDSVSVTVRRLGVIVSGANSTMVYPESHDVIAQAQLVGTGEGFLYNALPVEPSKP